LPTVRIKVAIGFLLVCSLAIGYVLGAVGWPGYERTSVGLLLSNSGEDDLRTHLEQGWEVERVEHTTYGAGRDIPTYILRRRVFRFG
jgi:hypothetical protein